MFNFSHIMLIYYELNLLCKNMQSVFMCYVALLTVSSFICALHVVRIPLRNETRMKYVTQVTI